jgi:hypothetical protein
MGNRIVKDRPDVMKRVNKEENGEGKQGSGTRLLILPDRYFDESTSKWVWKMNSTPAQTSTSNSTKQSSSASTIATRSLLIPESDIASNPQLSLLCTHGEIFADLWTAYKNPDKHIGAETMHHILESLSLPPKSSSSSSKNNAVGNSNSSSMGISSKERNVVLHRFVSLSQSLLFGYHYPDHPGAANISIHVGNKNNNNNYKNGNNESTVTKSLMDSLSLESVTTSLASTRVSTPQSTPPTKTTSANSQSLNSTPLTSSTSSNEDSAASSVASSAAPHHHAQVMKRLAKDLFTTNKFGDQTDDWIISFIVWQCVWAVHGERLMEVKKVADAHESQ